MTLSSKTLGCLYGQALGDAWAMPALFTPAQTWERFGGWIADFLPGPADHFVHAGLPAGKVTDDTEQAFALAEAIIADGRVTVEGTARAVVAWYDRIGGDTCPFVGPSTRRAVLAIKRGADLRTTGAHGDTNGAAMRISPVGLLHPGDPRGAAVDAAITCVPTHNTDVAVSGAAAVAGAVAAAMPDGATLDGIVRAGIESADEGRKHGNIWMGASVGRRIAMAVEIARSNMTDRDRLQELYDVIGTTLAISESVPAAFGVLAMAEGAPKQAAIYAAALSGDADTIGAMACAIAGAWRGAEAFEPAIIQKLRSANPELDFDGVAAGLAALTQSQKHA
nr:ADP-ribosylglycohydrolase family protein [Chloroflexota bacterium]